jgi:hypothetical protein
MAGPSERVILDLCRWTNIPEEELWAMTGEQADDVWTALQELARGRLTVEQATARLTASGFYDLPTLRAQAGRHVEEQKLEELRTEVDVQKPAGTATGNAREDGSG